MAGRNIRDRLLEQARREYSPKQRTVVLVVAVAIFLLILPGSLILLGRAVDRWLGLPKLALALLNPIFGGLVTLSGWLFGLWSVYVQFTIGRGTPVPLMATQKLIVQPPYSYCRNPMALGAIVMYLGVAIWIGSPGAAFLVLIGAAVLLTYIKIIEEKEMEIRFGREYLEYKSRTPFLFPRFRGKR